MIMLGKLYVNLYKPNNNKKIIKPIKDMKSNYDFKSFIKKIEFIESGDIKGIGIFNLGIFKAVTVYDYFFLFKIFDFYFMDPYLYLYYYLNKIIIDYDYDENYNDVIKYFKLFSKINYIDVVPKLEKKANDQIEYNLEDIINSCKKRFNKLKKNNEYDDDYPATRLEDCINNRKFREVRHVFKDYMEGDDEKVVSRGNVNPSEQREDFTIQKVVSHYKKRYIRKYISKDKLEYNQHDPPFYDTKLYFYDMTDYDITIPFKPTIINPSKIKFSFLNSANVQSNYNKIKDVYIDNNTFLDLISSLCIKDILNIDAFDTFIKLSLSSIQIKVNDIPCMLDKVYNIKSLKSSMNLDEYCKEACYRDRMLAYIGIEKFEEVLLKSEYLDSKLDLKRNITKDINYSMFITNFINKKVNLLNQYIENLNNNTVKENNDKSVIDIMLAAIALDDHINTINKILTSATFRIKFKYIITLNEFTNILNMGLDTFQNFIRYPLIDIRNLTEADLDIMFKQNGWEIKK